MVGFAEAHNNPMTMQVPDWFHPHQKSVNDRLDAIDRKQTANLEATERLIKMSETVSQQIDAAAARDEAATAKLSSDLAAIAAELKANAPPAGSVVTQAQADRHTAIAAALEAAAAAADALVVPPAPPAA